MKAIFARCTICHRGIDLSADIGKLAFSPSGDGLENLALAVREVMSDAMRCGAILLRRVRAAFTVQMRLRMPRIA